MSSTSASLALLIADTERLLANTTLGRNSIPLHSAYLASHAATRAASAVNIGIDAADTQAATRINVDLEQQHDEEQDQHDQNNASHHLDITLDYDDREHDEPSTHIEITRPHGHARSPSPALSSPQLSSREARISPTSLHPRRTPSPNRVDISISPSRVSIDASESNETHHNRRSDSRAQYHDDMDAADVQADKRVQQAYLDLNNLLKRCGFSELAIALAASSSAASSLPSQNQTSSSFIGSITTSHHLQMCSLFTTVLFEFMKRGTLVDDLLHKESQDSSSALSLTIEKQKTRIADLNNELVQAHLENDKQRQQLRSELEQQLVEHEHLQKKMHEAQQEIQQLKDTVRALHVELDVQISGVSRLQPTAAAKGDKRAQTSFHRLYGRAPLDGNEVDEQIMRVIRVYEAQHDDSTREIEALRRAVQDADALSKQRQAQLLQANEKDSLQHSSQENEVQQLRSQLRARDLEFNGQDALLRQREQDAQSELEEMRGKYNELDRQLRRATTELADRPTLDAVNELRVKIRDLERELTDVQGSRPQPQQHSSVRASSSKGDAAMDAINRLSRADLICLLHDACAVLDLNHTPQQLPTTLQQLVLLVRAHPELLKFVRQCLSVLTPAASPSSLSQALSSSGPTTMHELTDAIAALHQMHHDAQRARSGAAQQGVDWESTAPNLRARLLFELQARRHRANTVLDDSTPMETLWQELADTVSTENRLYRLMYGAPLPLANEHTHLNPAPEYEPKTAVGDPHKMLAHFQHLFDVPSANGVLPKMSELFTFVNEQRVAMATLRTHLMLPATSTTHAVLNTLLPMLVNGVNSKQDADQGLLEADTLRLQEAFVGDHDADAQQENEFERANTHPHDDKPMSAHLRNELVLRELLDLLGVDNTPEIVHVVERLLEKNAQSSTATSKAQISDEKAREYRSVLKHLKQELAVAHVSEILSAVRALKAQSLRSVTRAIADDDESSSLDSRVLANVSEMLRAEQVSDIIPALEQVIITASLYEDIIPSVNQLVDQLYEELQVDDLSDIVPAIAKLRQLLVQVSEEDKSRTGSSRRIASISVITNPN